MQTPVAGLFDTTMGVRTDGYAETEHLLRHFLSRCPGIRIDTQPPYALIVTVDTPHRLAASGLLRSLIEVAHAAGPQERRQMQRDRMIDLDRMAGRAGMPYVYKDACFQLLKQIQARQVSLDAQGVRLDLSALSHTSRNLVLAELYQCLRPDGAPGLAWFDDPPGLRLLAGYAMISITREELPALKWLAEWCAGLPPMVLAGPSYRRFGVSCDDPPSAEQMLIRLLSLLPDVQVDHKAQRVVIGRPYVALSSADFGDRFGARTESREKVLRYAEKRQRAYFRRERDGASLDLAALRQVRDEGTGPFGGHREWLAAEVLANLYTNLRHEKAPSVEMRVFPLRQAHFGWRPLTLPPPEKVDRLLAAWKHWSGMDHIAIANI